MPLVVPLMRSVWELGPCCKNQIMLILVDSGSSSSFVSSRFVERVGLKVVPCVSAQVRVANGNILRGNTMVKVMEWWANGHTYVSNMRMLELGCMMPF
jgi:hypothetical protein